MLDDRVTQEGLEQGRRAAELRTPSTSVSAGMGFAKTFTEVPRLAYDFSNALRGIPARNPLDNAFDIFDEAMKTPNEGWGQETVDFFAQGFGYINPFGGIIAKGVTSGIKASTPAISRALPEAINVLARTPIKNFGFKVLPNTVGQAGKQIAQSMAIGTAITAPGAMLDNYDSNTDTFSMVGAVKQSLSNGLLAVAIDAIPVAAGAIFGKHKKIIGEEYENPLPGDHSTINKFDSALKKGEISKGEHEFIKHYITKQKDIEGLKSKAINILIKEGYKVNNTDKTMLMDLIKQDHFDNFQSGMLDQISSGASGEFKSSLSDYAAASGMDFMKSNNESFIDGLNGYVHFMEARLSKAEENIKRFENAEKSSGLKYIDADHEASQKSLLNQLKKVDYDIQRIPGAIPSNMQLRIKQEKEISRLKKTKEDPSRLKELQSSRDKLLSPSNELKHIESRLLSKDKLPDNYKGSHDYHRLIDLAHFSTKADGLLHKVNIRGHYEEQESYKDMIKFLNSIIESNVNKFADPDKVMSYMKNRYDSVAPRAKDSTHKGSIRDQNQVPIDQPKDAYSERKPEEKLNDIKNDFKHDVSKDDQIIQDGETDVLSVGDKDFEKEYKIKADRYKQFRDNQSALSTLLSCELGTRNVEV